MKKGFTRILCALLVMLLCLGQLVGITPVQAATTVNYRYGSVSGFSNVIYNWGERGEIADFMSPNAEKFYDKYTSYEELSQLSGSSSVSSLNSSALFKQLRSMVTNAQKKTTSYNDTRDLYKFTDCQNSALTSNKISSFYSGKEIGPSWDGGATWNREHTWPNSKGDANGNGENDIMMLRPASVSENSGRGNKAYGKTAGTTYYNPNSQSGGVYDLRGDVARLMLYVYVRWSTASPSVMFGSSGVIESKEVMLEWIEADPVDTWELGRNDSVESITGTRNVFVDYPELAFLLFNEEIPADYTTPSGNAATPAYNITASSNNTAYGTVTLSGRTITATPKAGYQVSGYTVLSGNATVTQNGNTFTVAASSDCSIRINFTQRTVYTATFTENGVTTGTASSYDTITLPSATVEATDGYTFAGWVTQTVEETNNKPAVYAAGSSYTLTSNANFHALYAIRTEEGGSGDEFTRYSGELTDGDYLVVYSDGALTAATSSDRFTVTAVAASNDAITTENGAIIWRIEKQSDGTVTIYNENSGKYAAGNGTKNKGALITTVTDFAKWTATGNSTYEFVNVGNKAAGVNANLRRNGSYGFATYATSTGGALTLYKRGSGSTFYTTSLPGQPAYTVVFRDYDGTVISEEKYFEGDTVAVPADPARPADENYTYEFAGWTPEVTAVTGDATYTATYTATKIVVENAIVKQPVAVTVQSGDTVQFSVVAQGEVVSYKWEYRSIYKWFNTTMEGYNTDTLTVDATGARNGYDYRCVVTFADGTVITSDMAELTVKTQIINVGSPNDQVVVNGYKGQFTASATGEGLKYRWYYQRPDGTIWSETSMEGCERPTVFIESTAARDGYKYKCKITDVTGNVVYTEVATMRVLTFKSHPQNATGSVGDNVTFTVTTSVEEGFTYQWQYRRNATATWTNTTMTGYNTDTLTVPVTAARNGYAYRCVLTGSKNSKIESKAAVLTVTEPVKITAQPKAVTCTVGEAAIFTVAAENVASYQWQYQSATNTTRWSNTGATGNKTATLSITATTGNNGYKYRCVITGIDGNQYITEVATLTVN